MPRRLGEKLRFLRTERQISQVEVAQLIGLASSSYVSYLESGRNVPSLELLIGLASYYSVSLDFLLRDDVSVEQSTSQYQPIDATSWPGNFAAKLTAYRNATGLTQSALATRLTPTTQAFISMLESGRKVPSVELTIRIADVFGVRVDALFLPQDSSLF